MSRSKEVPKGRKGRWDAMTQGEFMRHVSDGRGALYIAAKADRTDSWVYDHCKEMKTRLLRDDVRKFLAAGGHMVRDVVTPGVERWSDAQRSNIVEVNTTFDPHSVAHLNSMLTNGLLRPLERHSEVYAHVEE